uniref:Pyridoxamine 5'-phosphate oxidase family protein n=1 Tax=Desulfomonile tiedjei TaxID=2358 RepID=A0A7C4EYH4_9BACT
MNPRTKLGKTKGKENSMTSADDTRKKVESLLRDQILGVLATHEPDQAYLSLVAFCHTSDLRRIIFASDRSTRKYANLTRNPRAAILIDNRSAAGADFRLGITVTAFGRVHEIEDSNRSEIMRLYLEKHPRMADFVTSPSTALLYQEVEYYYVVDNSQNVTTMRMTDS